jgi:hypothetical protein
LHSLTHPLSADLSCEPARVAMTDRLILRPDTARPPRNPFPARSSAIRALRPRLRSEDLIDRARRASGLVDFGDTPFRAGLDQFLRACNDETQLSLFGYFGTRWDVCRFLTNLLRMRHEELKAPEILDEPLDPPLFVMGMPRSGTTFLHRLLTADAANRAPLVWELIHPYALLDAKGRKDCRRQEVSRQIRLFGLLSPDFKRMHPIDADSPQECSEITAHTFVSLRFDTTYWIPSYRRWIDAVGHLDAYRFHKRFLQHLQHQDRSRRRWVLKSPDHIFALDALRQVYPDARIVFVHRDPLHVMASNARLTEVLRKPFTRHVDRFRLGAFEEKHWVTATELMIAGADQEPFREPIFHIHYRDLVGDPLRVLTELYHHFGMVLEQETVNRIIRMLEEAPNGGYGANRYSPETYGLDQARLRRRFSPYIDRFAIPTSSRGRTVEFSRGAAAG